MKLRSFSYQAGTWTGQSSTIAKALPRTAAEDSMNTCITKPAETARAQLTISNLFFSSTKNAEQHWDMKLKKYSAHFLKERKWWGRVSYSVSMFRSSTSDANSFIRSRQRHWFECNNANYTQNCRMNPSQSNSNCRNC